MQVLFPVSVVVSPDFHLFPFKNRYWHRSLNPKKLIEVKFSHLARNMTMQRTLKLYRLPEETKTPGFRTLELKDIEQAYRLLNTVSPATFLVALRMITSMYSLEIYFKKK